MGSPAASDRRPAAEPTNTDGRLCLTGTRTPWCIIGWGIGAPLSAIPRIPILLLLFGPTLSALAQLALSRSRGLEADRRAAELSGDPEGLASALQQLESWSGGLWY